MLINAWRMYLSQLGRTANEFSRISRSLARMKARRRPLSRVWRFQSLEDRTLLSSTPVISIVADINDKAVSSSSGGWVSIGSYTYFAHDDGIHGNELWRTDGTLAGTSLVADIVPGSESSNIQNLTDVGGTLYFRAEDPIHGSELWKSD